MASPEQRIYQNSPKAPTPGELKDGIRLLLDRYGNQHPSFLSVSVGKSNLDGLPNTIVQFSSLLNKRGAGQVGLNMLSRVTPNEQKYDMDIAVDINSNRKRKKLVAVDKHTGRKLSARQRRAVGQIILTAWEMQ